jgi:hypothetical protein
VLRLALLDLTLLLVGVDVYREIIPTGVPSDLLQPPSRDRPDAVGRDADLDEGMLF